MAGGRARRGVWGAVVRWVDLVTPWFGVAVVVLVGVWLAFPTARAVGVVAAGSSRGQSVWATAALYGAALVGVVLLAFVGVRAARPAAGWPSDAGVRVLTGLSLVLLGLTFPLLVLRGELVPLAALLVYYVRIRRTLVAILPAWAGGTWRPPRDRRRPAGEAIKRPPRGWDGDPRGDRPARREAGASRRTKGKKGRRPRR